MSVLLSGNARLSGQAVDQLCSLGLCHTTRDSRGVRKARSQAMCECTAVCQKLNITINHRRLFKFSNAELRSLDFSSVVFFSLIFSGLKWLHRFMKSGGSVDPEPEAQRRSWRRGMWVCRARKPSLVASQAEVPCVHCSQGGPPSPPPWGQQPGKWPLRSSGTQWALPVAHSRGGRPSSGITWGLSLWTCPADLSPGLQPRLHLCLPLYLCSPRRNHFIDTVCSSCIEKFKKD